MVNQSLTNRDHPRIRGTNSILERLRNNSSGSSPHTRDKCKILTLAAIALGIIPAYAGQIAVGYFGRVYSEDHPRIRGTNFVNTSPVFINPGSSPHTRDKFRLFIYAKYRQGIIPAYAGQIRG